MLSPSRFIVFVVALALMTSSVSLGGEEVAFAGQVRFSCDLKAAVMQERHGHKFIRTIPNGRFISNEFGASGMEIVVKNSKGEIVGLVTTSGDGSFKVAVEASNFYTLEMEFLNIKYKLTFARSSVGSIAVDLGRLQSESF